MITDADLAYLMNLNELSDLDLSYCKRITDAGLKHLHGLKKLRHLDLSQCRKRSIFGSDGISRSGVAALEKALPRCEIWWPD